MALEGLFACYPCPQITGEHDIFVDSEQQYLAKRLKEISNASLV